MSEQHIMEAVVIVLVLVVIGIVLWTAYAFRDSA